MGFGLPGRAIPSNVEDQPLPCKVLAWKVLLDDQLRERRFRQRLRRRGVRYKAEADAFLQFILSGEGQKIAADFGHATLSEELAKDALDALDVTYVAPPEEDAEAAVETDE